MKILYKHIIDLINSDTKPTIDELSSNLFQLGHEHEIENDILNFELTPNRGDCLSLRGILRDLSVFYSTNVDQCIYKKSLESFNFQFNNKTPKSCSDISFLKLEISGDISPYKGALGEYFDDMRNKKNNFFTDVSNYISYETGQPTHCYDSTKISEPVDLRIINDNCSFKTLLGKKIELTGDNLVFSDSNAIINLAGIVGSESTSCDKDTYSVIVECAHFNPEDIIGKSLKYDIASDAAHKFERGVDHALHEYVLRRFLQIVEDHTNIKSAKFYSKNFKKHPKKLIPYDLKKLSMIIGIDLKEDFVHKYLHTLGFIIQNDSIEVPSHRSDVNTINDIAEEVARVIGYDNIPRISFKIPKTKIKKNDNLIEINLKNHLVANGFYEVINNPFVNEQTSLSIELDNPLDSNKRFMRTNLMKSLINNLSYNEKRQKDSIKLFEISNIYSSNQKTKKRVIGIIASGRVEKNYINFSKKINKQYLENILKEFAPNYKFSVENISRDSFDSKIKNELLYCEIDLDKLKESKLQLKDIENKHFEFIKVKKISDYPSSSRDLSYAIKNPEKFKELESLLLNYNDPIVKEIFVFDFYNDEKNNVIKVGFRITFQSIKKTVTEAEINIVFKDIINKSTSIESVTIPGLA